MMLQMEKRVSRARSSDEKYQSRWSDGERINYNAKRTERGGQTVSFLKRRAKIRKSWLLATYQLTPSGADIM